MTRRGFLSSMAAIVASPKAAADVAVTAALFGGETFHDIRPKLRYSWNGVGILPGEAMAAMLMEDLDAYEREGRLAERMDELGAHGDSLEEYACGEPVKIPLTRRWLEEFRRRRASEAAEVAK